MPKDDDKGNSNVMLVKSQQKSRVNFVYREHIYLKIVNYEVVRDQKFKEFMMKNISFRGEILQVLQQITKLMYNYSIDVAFADSAAILDNVTRTNKLSKS